MFVDNNGVLCSALLLLCHTKLVVHLVCFATRFGFNGGSRMFTSQVATGRTELLLVVEM